MTCSKMVKILVVSWLCAENNSDYEPATKNSVKNLQVFFPRHGKGAGRRLWDVLTGHRFGGSVILAILGLLCFSLTRFILLILSRADAELSGFGLAGILFYGLINDLVVSAYATLPLTLWLALIPQRFFERRGQRRTMMALIFLVLSGMLFLMLAECVFWGEFASRFNFIAIDYLIYTTEVLTNIWESYPIFWLLAAIFATAAILAWGMQRSGILKLWLASSTGCTTRWSVAVIHVVAVVFLAFAFNNQTAIPQSNPCNVELARNGIHSLFAAYSQNELDYSRFYLKIPLQEIGLRLRRNLSEPNTTFVNDEALDIRRNIVAIGPEQKRNVVIIVEESLSASFTGCLGGKELTPNLDRLAREGLLFSRCFATGTRTVRGLEAVTLSMPPTPGQSIVRRPDNGDLFSLGKLFRSRGYVNTFVYGGYGRFDNMNSFFSSNGYSILDRSSPQAEPQSFATAWGVCDGDMFQWALRAADLDHANGQPFHQLIMTTSNHRPYTFPEDDIDAPQKRRFSAVLYSDQALGAYLAAASSKDWFANTLFIVVADHCHSTSGRQKLPIGKYHIPLVFYAPKWLPPRTMDTICSQIDVAPTLCGLLGWSYQSQFYGHNVLNLPENRGQAPLGTFQTLGLLAATGTLTLLDPMRKLSGETWSLTLPFSLLDAKANTDPADCIALYQSATRRHQLGLDRNDVSTSPLSLKKLSAVYPKQKEKL
ncbi:MAG: LTA synthase family protein [Lentisphaeria bacterium]